MSATSPLVDELRHLYSRSEYDSIISRTDHLHKRKHIDDISHRALVPAIRAYALIHLARFPEARPIIDSLNDKDVGNSLIYARLYLACATNERVPEALNSIHLLSGPDANRLHAHLLYRSADYRAASEQYAQLLNAARFLLDEKKRPAARSLWSLTTNKPQPAPVTAAELAQLTGTVNELATNNVAALVLASQFQQALAVASQLHPTYELQYNTACALIGCAKYQAADTALEKAEALVRADLDDEIDDVEEALAPVRVQRAYLQHLRGDVAGAKMAYVAVLSERKADAASTAVAANNVSVALGQLAFGSREQTQDTEKGGKVLPKEQHDALVEGLKKMKATSGRSVQRNLTTIQRRAMARNRAILLVQMGRVDACRTEIGKLKSEFPNDPLLALIEATLIAREGSLATADKVLQLAGDDERLRAARIQLAATKGDQRRAVELLEELFKGKPAAVVTAAALLEQLADVKAAVGMLKQLVADSSGESLVAASKVLAKTLLRNEQYEDGAATLRDVCKQAPADVESKALLAVAASYVNPTESEQLVSQLPYMSSSITKIDAKALEALPPPKRKHTTNWKQGETNGVNQGDAAARAEAARLRKKKKRKKRLPKNYDPDGPAPDPERWLPKTLRAGYKKKKSKDNNFRGAQGADAAAAEVAAVKNERVSAAKMAAAVEGGNRPPKIQRKKRARR